MIKILIVEDDEELASMLAFQLRQQKHKVFICYDAAQAMTIVYKEKPDLLILDIKIPAGNGLSLAEHVNNSELSGIKFIFLSAYLNDENKQLASNLGSSLLLEKPLDSEKLRLLLKDVQEMSDVRNLSV